MRKVITFLGTSPRETTYSYKGGTYRGRVFGEALYQFLDFDQMLVFATEEATEATWPILERLRDPRIHRVPISLGEGESHLWDLFDRLIEVVDTDDKVVFDITHSFRFMPFLVFLAAAYLREARDVSIDAIYYGAYEMGNEEEGKPAPVLDLSPFVSLLDWLTASNQFVHTGDARYMADLLGEQGRLRRSGALKRAGESLRSFSLAMMLCRPLEVLERAGRLEADLERAKPDLAWGARPFGLLAARIQEEYASRALREPTAPENVVESLRRQLALVRWYLGNNQVIQAMTLAREWLVTAVGWRLGRGFVLRPGERADLEWALSGLARVGRQEKDGTTHTEQNLNEPGKVVWAWPSRDALRRLCNDIESVRNELAHAGMRPDWAKAARLTRKAREDVWPGLKSLATGWGLA